MKKGRFNRKTFLIVVLLLISLGYALLSSNLTINGNSKLASSTWDIHFDNVVPKEGRVSIGENESEAVINPNDNTEVTYNITLSKPGDFYEFNVDIVNTGSIDGQVERINSRLKIGDEDAFVITDDNLPPYLNYLITYSDDSEIMPNHLLKSGKSETIKVRIEFKRDIDSSILPPDDIDLTLTIQPDLIQENKEGYNKGEEPYTPFTYDIDLDSVQNATIQYDKINQEACVEFFSQYFPSEEDSEAFCSKEDVEYNGDTINIEDDLTDSSSDFLQYLSDNGVITLKYVKDVFDIDISKCIDFLNDQGWYDNEEDKELYCSDQIASDGYSISIDANDGYLEELVEFGAIKNVENGEIKPDVIITGYKEEVPTNLEIPREINGKKVVGISDDSFDNKGITSVTIPNTVEYIGANAFDNNDLYEVSINGDNVNIGNCAFGNKDNITTNNIPNDYICLAGCITGSNELYDNYEYSKGQYNYYYIESDDGWGVRLRDTNSSKPVTSKLCSLVDEKPIISMANMFSNSNTTSIDLSSFDTSHIKNMSGMFSNCDNIKQLDLRNFDTSNVKDMSNMFYDSYNLRTIFATDTFITDNVDSSHDMFMSDLKLVGGKGTVYDDNHIDDWYAHLDEGKSNPGYFTYKGDLTIELNPNGGSVPIDKIYPDKKKKIGYLPTPVREGYAFLGWYTNLDFTTKITDNSIAYNNMVLFAKWKVAENVEITFDKNNENATGLMDKQNVLEGVEINLISNEYELVNYAFIGWNTEIDGSGDSYGDGDLIVPIGNMTLYAQWARIYTLTFDKNNNDATGNSYSMSILSGIPTQIPKIAFKSYSLPDKVIESYNTKSDYSGTSYYKSQYITVTADTTLYAYWDDPQVTDTIYWAIQKNGNNGKKLVFADYELEGKYKGNFAGDTEFESDDIIPWTNLSYDEEKYDSDDNLCYSVGRIEILNEIVPVSTAYWFAGVGYRVNSLEVDLEELDTSLDVNMKYMFAYAGYNTGLINMNLSDWDVSNVRDMSYMFYKSGENAGAWSIGDISNWNIKNVTDTSYMFYNVETNYSSVFDLGNLDNWDTSNVEDMSNMFGGTAYWATDWNIGDLSNWKTSKVTDMSYMFYGVAGYNATTWSIGDLSDWDVSNVTDMSYMFMYAGACASDWDIGELSEWNTLNVTDMNHMFTGTATAVTSLNIDFSNWKTSKVTDMHDMFTYFGSSATTFDLDLSDWDVSNVTDMSWMFYSAGYDASIWNIGDLSNWNVSNVTDMTRMFEQIGYNATSLSLDLSNWNTSKVKKMTLAFASAGTHSPSLNIDLSNWNTSNVEDMDSMFSDAGLTSSSFSLDLSNWDTSNVTKMGGAMFSRAGRDATTWNITIPKDNKNGIDNTTTKMYGKTSSVYATSPSDAHYVSRLFTLAN